MLNETIDPLSLVKRNHLTKSLALILFAFVAYYLSARLGLEVATINKHASPVWPATGIAMTLIFLFGPRLAIGIFFGAFWANYEAGLNFPAALGIGFGNTAESLFFLWAFRHLDLRPSRYGVHSKAIRVIFILVCATSISATVGSLALWMTSTIPVEAISKNWTTWWIGDLLGALFIAPIAYKSKFPKFESFKFNPTRLLRYAICTVSTLLLCQFIFASEQGGPYLFLIFLPVLLSANWFHSIWVHIIALGICVFSVWQTIVGNGPFVGNSLNDNLVHLQIFLAGLSITAIGLGSLKQEGFHFRLNFALLFGWMLSGLTFYFAYTSTAAEENGRFLTKIAHSKEAVESRMGDYIRVLESGVSFFDASEHVSKSEWRSFAQKILSTNHYPGIEGIGVIFSSSIKDRFEKSDRAIQDYQPNSPTRPVPNIADGDLVEHPEDIFVVTYLEPEVPNQAAIGLNVSTEKLRYEAILRARDTGSPSVAKIVRLAQDREDRPGFLVFLPIYKTGMAIDSVKARRAAFLGTVYAPVIFSNFFSSAVKQFDGDVSLAATFGEQNRSPAGVESGTKNSGRRPGEIRGQIDIVGNAIDVVWRRGGALESPLSLVASWIGFFGTITSLFLAVMLSSLQNLTMRAQNIAAEMTKEVNRRKRAWQAITETSPVGIYLTDKNGGCTYVNSKWSEMTGISLDAAAGSGWLLALHPEDRKTISERWNRLIDGEVFVSDYRFLRDDGRVVYVTGQAVPLRDDDNNISGYFGTVQDITQLHQNQIALLTSSRMSSLGQMASGIAHEINNPLSVILGKAFYLETVLEGTNLEKARDQVRQINGTVQKISKIIKGLQDFARETSGEPFAEAFVKDLLSDTLELCRERFTHFSVQLQVPDDVDPLMCFLGRAEQISQVLVNLLNNAFDAAILTAEKWVKIEVRAHAGIIQIVVSDSGRGIEPAIQGRIFDPFFTSKEVGKGTGLGLSISKGIVDRHQGKLYVDAARMNTTFVLELRQHFDR